MAQGTIKWFNGEKGFGFIAPADGGKDVFVHISGLQGDASQRIDEGVPVEYDTREGRKGLEAFDVRVV